LNKLLKDTSIYTVGSIIPKAASFLLLPIYTEYLSPDQYGIVNSMQVIQGLLLVLFSLTLERAIYRLYWDYESEESKKNFLGTITISILVVSVLSLALLYIFRDYVEKIYTSISFFPFYSYSILITFFSIFSLVPMVYFMVKQKPWTYFIISLLKFVTYSGFVLWFIVIERGGAEGMLKGGGLAGIFMLPLYIYILIKTVNFKFDFQILKSSLDFCLPFIPSMIVSWVLTLSDRVFIERYLTLSDVGIYSMANKIAGISSLLFGGFSQAYFPIFFKLANSKDQNSAQKKLYKFNNISVILVIILGFIIALYSKDVILLLMNKKYLDAYYFVPIMCLTFIFTYLGGLADLFFQQSKKNKQNMYIAIIAALLSLVLNFILIPSIGVMGAALSVLIAYSVGFFISFFYAKKNCYFIPLNWNIITPILSILFFIAFTINFLVNINVIISIILKTVIIITASSIFIRFYFEQLKEMLPARFINILSKIFIING